MKNEYMKEKD